MRRALRFLLRNWPLKLAAIFLASLLYAGIVLAQNARTWSGGVPIEAVRPPTGAVLLEQSPAEMTSIRYRAPVDVQARVSSADFRATVDLARIVPEANGQPEQVRVSVEALDRRIEVVDFEPKSVTVRLDPVITRTVPVTIDRGVVPEGLALGREHVDPNTVVVRGASSLVLRVREVVARVTIDASGLNVDSEVDLAPVDERGEAVPKVELSTERARVQIEVARQLANRTLPVSPQLVGQLPQGFRLASVAVRPLSVTVSGEQRVLAGLDAVTTQPVSLDGVTESRDVASSLAVPPEVTVVDGTSVTVELRIVADTGSRSYQAGIALTGARPDLTYALATPSVVVTLGGAVGALSALSTTDVVVTVAVDALGTGTQELPLAVKVPPNIQVMSIAPARVRVTVSPPGPPAPSNSAAATPGPAETVPGPAAASPTPGAGGLVP